MPIETRSNSALFKRAEQLKLWEDSETNKVPATIPKDKKSKIKFSDGCVFLAACAASDTEEVERLLEQGTDINTANVDGLTALHQACIDDNLEMVQFLVEHGCDVNRGDNEGWTPLHATASCGFLSIAKYLIEHGANVAAVNNDGDLPIDISESSEMEEYLSDVLDAKEIDCDEARSEEERIMLEDACLMLNSSLDVNERVHPRTGATPLHVAAAKGYIDVMKILIQAGVDLNAQDNDGWTSLHAAAHWCHKEASAVLADNLANMDIQNFAGQTCFDVADSEIVNLLVELKKKQESMQEERPEIQAILQRTSTRPPFKRRTSVTRMSIQEKSKSVMKDTKAERAHFANLSLPEEENEEDKEKRQAENSELLKHLIKHPSEQAAEMALSKTPRKTPPCDTKETPTKQPEGERIPSWKKVLRRSAEENVNLDSSIPEVILKRPKKVNEDKNEKDDENLNKDGHSSIPVVRDDGSELQRKAHAKRVRETRRSTQGVLLEDIKSAELQYLISTQQEAAIRQAKEAEEEALDFVHNKSEISSSVTPDTTSKRVSKQNPDEDSKEKNDSHSCKVENSGAEESEKPDNDTRTSGIQVADSLSVTVSLKPKSASFPEDKSPSEGRTSLSNQPAVSRRRRPKRRPTGVVYLDSDDAQEEKENNDKDSSNSQQSKTESGHAEQSPTRYGSSTSVAESETSTRSDTSSRYSSRVSLNDEDKDYKKLYEEVRKENERLKEALKKTEEDLEKTKKQLQKLSQSSTMKNSLSENEKKERRTLERKLSEMEEEVKNISKLKTENEKLKAENRALSRVVCKLSK